MIATSSMAHMRQGDCRIYWTVSLHGSFYVVTARVLRQISKSTRIIQSPKYAAHVELLVQ